MLLNLVHHVVLLVLLWRILIVHWLSLELVLLLLVLWVLIVLSLLSTSTLDGIKPVLLLVVQHLVAFNVAQVAHVANFSKRIVVVETSLASPVPNSLSICSLFLNLIFLTLECFWLLVLNGSSKWIGSGIRVDLVQVGHLLLLWFFSINFCLLLNQFVLFLSQVFSRFSSLQSNFLLDWQKHMFWLSIVVTVIFIFLASKALFSSFEVVVLALLALPSSFREIELLVLLSSLSSYLSMFHFNSFFFKRF